MLYGATLLVLAWASRPSFWLDEIFVALNLQNRDLGDLFGPLDYRQVAPLGFLAAQKAMASLFGYGESVLRFLPMLSVALALLCLPALLRRFGGELGAAVGVWLLVTSEKVYHLSVQAKANGFDLAAGIVLPWLFISSRDRGGRWPVATVVAASGIAALSFGSWIVIAGSLAAGSWWVISRPRAARGVRPWLPILGSGAAVLVLFAVTRRAVPRESLGFMREFWSDSFPADGVSLPAWGLSRLGELSEGARWLPGSTPGAGWWLLALIAIAWLASGSTQRRNLELPVAVLAATLAVTALGLYPAEGRLSLFTLPMIGALLSASLGPLDRWTSGRSRWRIVAVALLAGWALTRAQSVSTRQITQQPQKPRQLFDQLALQVREGDRVYVRYSAEPAFRYYAPRVGLRPHDHDVRTGVCPSGDLQGYRADLEWILGSRRVWVVVSSMVDREGHEAGFLDLLRSIGREERMIIARRRPGRSNFVGEAALLFDFSAASVTPLESFRARLDSLPPIPGWKCAQFELASPRGGAGAPVLDSP